MCELGEERKEGKETDVDMAQIAAEAVSSYDPLFALIDSFPSVFSDIFACFSSSLQQWTRTG
jgi:hypothetical protein